MINVKERSCAIVTGAAQGIGAAIARQLSADGFAVALLDLDDDACAPLAEELTTAGRAALAVGVDVSDEHQVKGAIERVAAELGDPLVLVNNAGVTRDNLLFKMTSSDWDSVMNVHLRGAFLMSRAVQSYMVERGWGRIIGLSSTSALGNRGQSNYSAAKAGVQGFTKTLALELGRFGVTVNAIAPGFIETEMTVRTAEQLGMSFQELRQKVASQVAVGRTGMPADIAHAVSYFASENSGYVSGQILYVAGGPKG